MHSDKSHLPPGISEMQPFLKSVVCRGYNDELSPSLSQLCCLRAVAGSPVVTEEDLDGMLHLPEVVQRQIQLSTKPAENQLLRSEFYYEQVWIPTFLIPQDQSFSAHRSQLVLSAPTLTILYATLLKMMVYAK